MEAELLKLLSAFAEAGIIDQSGLFVESIAPELFSKNGNTTRFLLVEQGNKSIYVEQVDIRSIQLAKAALICRCFNIDGLSRVH